MAPRSCASIGIASPRIRGEAGEPSGLVNVMGRRPTGFVAFTPQKKGRDRGRTSDPEPTLGWSGLIDRRLR